MRSPGGRHYRPSVAKRRARPGPRTRRMLSAGRVGTALAVAATIGLALPAGVAGAESTAANGSAPTLKVLMARANKLSNEIDNLSGGSYDFHESYSAQ